MKLYDCRVYGIRVSDIRGTLRYTADGDVIYPATSAVVVYTKSKHRQRHFMDHKHEVVSIAIHPNGNIVATGEVGEKPSVLLWNTRTLKQIQAMSTVIRGAVSLLSFSPDGKRLACVADDTFHCLIVYDWEAGKILFKDQIGRQKVFDCQFIDGSRIFTCGLNNVTFGSAELKRMCTTKSRGFLVISLNARQ